MKTAIPVTILFLLVAFGVSGTGFALTSVPTMTKEELKPLLGTPGVVVLDVRAPRDYDESNAMVKGAVRVDMKVPIEAWMDRYPKETTLVFY